MRLVWLAILLVACSGCSSQPETTASTPPVRKAPATAESREKVLYEQVRSGHYQLHSALDPLETATLAAKDLADGQDDPQTKKAVLTLQQDISGAGSAIADYTEDPPSYDEFAKQFDEQDDDRLKAIDGCEKAITMLRDASSSSEDMLASGPPAEESKKLGEIKEAVSSAQSAIEDAKKTLGGR